MNAAVLKALSFPPFVFLNPCKICKTINNSKTLNSKNYETIKDQHGVIEPYITHLLHSSENLDTPAISYLLLQQIYDF